MRFSRFSFLFLAFIAGVSAAEFSLQTVDGLSRPIPRVHVEVACMSHNREVVDFHLQSAEDGTIHRTYDSALCTPMEVRVQKQGYESYSSGFRARYVLQRQFGSEELLRVIKLEGDTKRQELRELLAGDFSREGNRFRDLVFYYEARLRFVLQILARDPSVTERARDLLSMIGVPEDLQLIMRLAPPPASLGFPERWRYAVATALVNPDDEDEWSFLRACALK